METARICLECRTPLTSDAPQGLCPTCLLKQALAKTVSGSSGSSATRVDLKFDRASFQAAQICCFRNAFVPGVMATYVMPARNHEAVAKRPAAAKRGSERAPELAA